jgi:hypothetical protein
MRHVGESVGAPAATVSQVEKGQRALKEPRIGPWAAALDVSEADLHELWLLCQGLVPVGRDRLFYGDRPDALGSTPLDAKIITTLRDRPDFEALYRLAVRIAVVVERLLPKAASVHVEPDEFEIPFDPDMDESGALVTSPSNQKKLEAAFAAFVPLPVIWIYWADATAPRPHHGFTSGNGVRMPLLEKPTPVVRRRGKSVNTLELEELIRELSGPERERVRGYVEAVVEQRATQEG